MLVFSMSDFAQNVTKVFDAAQTDEVIINNDDGKSYKILPVQNAAQNISPFDNIPCITVDITTQGIVDIIRESRAGK